ncbi:hypothetical protein FJZ33_07150 [Candidatus Poribacteria bacterium]|nr:hypothetical protein [Candidatus Poribacteria bacterium]
MIYVSCNPTTLARDLQYLSNSGYNIQKLNVLDMFPMTYHSEVIVLLTS